jgi:hypothetical protein
MLTLSDIHALVRDLSNKKVLSVYIETRVANPAMRDAWRRSLASALRDLAATVPLDERAAFDRAKAALDSVVPTLGTTPGSDGWTAFATADGQTHAADVPARCPTLVAWRDGPLVAPYMRVLKEFQPVVVALVDSRSARIYRYAWGTLSELPELALTVDEHTVPGTDPGARRSGKAIGAPRSVTGTEEARTRQLAAFKGLSTKLAARLTELATDGAWIVLGGTREWARLAAEALPAHVADHVTVSATLEHDASALEIMEAAKHSASSLRTTRGKALLQSLLDHSGASGRAATGLPGTQRALRASAVDMMLVSPEFVQAEADDAEETVRAALLQGAEIEVLSGDAASRLNRDSGGIAARLRFAVN